MNIRSGEYSIKIIIFRAEGRDRFFYVSVFFAAVDADLAVFHFFIHLNERYARSNACRDSGIYHFPLDSKSDNREAYAFGYIRCVEFL